MDNITIKESYTLPSLGKIYKKEFNPDVELRSMTVAEEMKRLTATDTPYKTMSDIIDDCLTTKLPISSYDMCLGDYQYLLHKLRTVTYGPMYKLIITCPYCGLAFEHEIDLDKLGVNKFDGDKSDLSIKLPSTGDTIEIFYQTPRDLDNIDKRKKDMKKQFPDMNYDPTLLLNIQSIIKSINGNPVDLALIQSYIKNLPMRDTSLILDKAKKLNEKVGVDINIKAHHDACNNDVNSTFRFTSEFFRPKID